MTWLAHAPYISASWLWGSDMSDIRTIETGSYSSAQGELVAQWAAGGETRAVVLVDGREIEGRLVPKVTRETGNG